MAKTQRSRTNARIYEPNGFRSADISRSSALWEAEEDRLSKEARDQERKHAKAFKARQLRLNFA